MTQAIITYLCIFKRRILNTAQNAEEFHVSPSVFKSKHKD